MMSQPISASAAATRLTSSPASNIKQADLETGCEALRRAGYKPFYFDSSLDRDIYFAGSVERRVQELEAMFERDEVRAIVCARGGYGANYLLNQLDLEKIESHPKIFVGYSDITCLLTHFTDAAGLVTFHGPMAAKDWAHEGGVDQSSWQSTLSQSSPWDVPLNQQATGLVDGEAQGMLYGGCLSILVASLGTPFEIKTTGAILFLEDVAAKPFQVDRMLMQLKLAGHLAAVRASSSARCSITSVANPGLHFRSQVRICRDLGIPIAFGVKSGHVTSGNITLPFGVQANLSVKNRQVNLRILESAVSG
jgi:muramoyltetrapeptide carboxypeptidase